MESNVMHRTRMTDDERRQLIVQRNHRTKRDPRGRYLDLRISLHDDAGFIRACDGGAPDLSCSTDEVVLAEVAKLLQLLRCEQQAAT